MLKFIKLTSTCNQIYQVSDQHNLLQIEVKGPLLEYQFLHIHKKSTLQLHYDHNSLHIFLTDSEKFNYENMSNIIFLRSKPMWKYILLHDNIMLRDQLGLVIKYKPCFLRNYISICASHELQHLQVVPSCKKVK